MKPIALQYGNYYHIYNRGTNGTNLFLQNANYEHFLRLYTTHIEPIAETYAWVLMKNHFHVLVKIKEEAEIEYIKPKENQKDIQFAKKKKYVPVNQFSHLFNAYAKALNNQFNRTGSLFEHPFRRILVDSDIYFKQLISYIHYNPVKHRFTELPNDYPWSSYLSIISVKPTRLSREKVIGWYNSKQEFIEFHKQTPDEDFIRPYIIEPE